MKSGGVAGLLVVLLALSALGGLALATPVAAEDPSTTSTDSISGTTGGDSIGGVAAEAEQEVDVDRTRLAVDLDADGDAAWTVELWTRLGDDDSRDAFETLRSDIEEDPDPFVERFEERMVDTATAASDATGREMTIENVTVDVRTEALPQEYGVVTYRFEWTGFAAVDDTELRAGDAIDGFFLEEGTRLAVSWPDEYHEVAVDPEPDDRPGERVVVWRGGETDFVSGQPRVELTSDPDELPAEEPSEPSLGFLSVVVSALGLLAVAALAWLAYTGRVEIPGRGSEPSTTGDAPAGVSAGGSNTAQEPPAELLSNEEQVLRLLEEHGGRMKQQQVVQELDWTEARTSQVVTSMREDGEIEVFRIGRENVLALPEEADL